MAARGSACPSSDRAPAALSTSTAHRSLALGHDREESTAVTLVNLAPTTSTCTFRPRPGRIRRHPLRHPVPAGGRSSGTFALRAYGYRWLRPRNRLFPDGDLCSTSPASRRPAARGHPRNSPSTALPAPSSVATATGWAELHLTRACGHLGKRRQLSPSVLAQAFPGHFP
jgi:hypothetical protein